MVDLLELEAGLVVARGLHRRVAGLLELAQISGHLLPGGRSRGDAGLLERGLVVVDERLRLGADADREVRVADGVRVEHRGPLGPCLTAEVDQLGGRVVVREDGLDDIGGGPRGQLLGEGLGDGLAGRALDLHLQTGLVLERLDQLLPVAPVEVVGQVDHHPDLAVLAAGRTGPRRAGREEQQRNHGGKGGSARPAPSVGRHHCRLSSPR